LSAPELAAAAAKGEKAETIAQKLFNFKKNYTRISSTQSGRYHVPDGMKKSTIYEVKCVAKQGYTRQLKSYHATGKKVVLIVDNTTTLSKPLKQAIAGKKITLKTVDLQNMPKPKIVNSKNMLTKGCR